MKAEPFTPYEALRESDAPRSSPIFLDIPQRCVYLQPSHALVLSAFSQSACHCSSFLAVNSGPRLGPLPIHETPIGCVRPACPDRRSLFSMTTWSGPKRKQKNHNSLK